MNLNWLGLGWLYSRGDTPSLWTDLRSGRAGWPLRVGLSLAAAPLLAGVVLIIMGLYEVAGGRVQEEYMAVGMGLAGAIWCGTVGFLWATFRRWRRAITTTLTILAIWALTIPVCALVAEMSRRADLLIGGCIVLGISATLLVLSTVSYRRPGGRDITDRAGEIVVKCPGCGYSLVGLDSCHCPECGVRTTIDQLIAAQDYAVLRRRLTAPEADRPPDAPPAIRAPAQLPDAAGPADAAELQTD